MISAHFHSGVWCSQATKLCRRGEQLIPFSIFTSQCTECCPVLLITQCTHSQTLEANFTQDASTQNSNDTSKVADVNTASGFFYSGARRRGWFRVPPARLTTNSTSSDPLVQIFEFGSITFLILIFIVVCLVMCCNGDYCSPTSFGNLRLLWFAAFTKLPIASNEKSIFRVDEDDVRHEMDQTSETTDEAKLLRNRR